MKKDLYGGGEICNFTCSLVIEISSLDCPSLYCRGVNIVNNKKIPYV